MLGSVHALQMPDTEVGGQGGHQERGGGERGILHEDMKAFIKQNAVLNLPMVLGI